MARVVVLLSAKGIRRQYGPKTVLDGVELTVGERDRIGLMGRNGAGKSTLVRILAGQEEADDGEIIRRRDLSVSLVSQAPNFDPEQSIQDVIRTEAFALNLRLADELAVLEKKIETADEETQLELSYEHAELLTRFERSGGHHLDHLVHSVTDSLGVPPPDRVFGTLSLGEQRRVALSIGLITQPELLILDEPTNHLDMATIEWLETRLKAYVGSLILITHDRYFLENVATRIAEIERGNLWTYEGNYTEYMVKKAVREMEESKAENRRLRAITTELAWVRRGAPARTTKQKARLERFDSMVAAQPKSAMGDVAFRLPHPPRIGKTILELEGVSKAYGDKVLLNGLDLLFTKGARLGVVGPNGVGKSTLVKMIVGEVEPDSGTVRHGQNTVVVYADQARSDLDQNNTILEEVAGDANVVQVGENSVSVHSFLEQLLFDGATQRTKIGALSGGEKSRVSLAKALRVAGNLLILDEPTNDLDLATLRVLEDALDNYPGCTLLVSHDRYFLDRVATSLLVFEGDGKVVLHEGNYSDYVARTRKAEEPEPEPPPTKRASKPAPKAAAPQKKRRSFKEEFEFKGMEEKILVAEQAMEAIEQELADPEAIRRLGAKITKRTSELAKAKKQVEALYARWAELSELDSRD